MDGYLEIKFLKNTYCYGKARLAEKVRERSQFLFESTHNGLICDKYINIYFKRLERSI